CRGRGNRHTTSAPIHSARSTTSTPPGPTESQASTRSWRSNPTTSSRRGYTAPSRSSSFHGPPTPSITSWCWRSVPRSGRTATNASRSDRRSDVLAQLTQPVVDPRSLSGAHPLTAALVMVSTLACGIVIASVYKWTHRGLSYSQAFQFSLVMLGMLGAGIMLVASTGVIPAIGIIGGFSLIRFRTPVKDPKDMAYILFTLVVG